MKRNIILCGFMGCGKSTLGPKIAQKTGYEFIDMDCYIEKKRGLTVPEIFQRLGEPEFRRIEQQICRELAQKNGLVIATGGGALVNSENAEILRSSGTIVLLDVPLPVLQQRLKTDAGRPLLQKPNRAQVIAELFQKRMPLYRRVADLSVDAGAPSQAVVDRVIFAVKKWEEKNS